MQTANVLVEIGGDHTKGNQVPLYGVTPSEIAILRTIHGVDAVIDVEPAGEVERSNSSERNYLMMKYGQKVVEPLFPGIAARMYETLEELDLPADSFRAASRVTATSKPDKRAVDLAATEVSKQPVSDEDGIADMKSAFG
jgi:hypothetical protein